MPFQRSELARNITDLHRPSDQHYLYVPLTRQQGRYDWIILLRTTPASKKNGSISDDMLLCCDVAAALIKILRKIGYHVLTFPAFQSPRAQVLLPPAGY